MGTENRDSLISDGNGTKAEGGGRELARVPVAVPSVSGAWAPGRPSGDLVAVLELPELVAERLERATEDAQRDPSAVYLARLAASSRRTMGEALDVMAEILAGAPCSRAVFPWHRVRYEHAQQLRAQLVERYGALTVNKMLAALRGVLKESWMLGLLDGESYQRAIVVKNVEASRLSTGQVINPGELAALFAACDDGTPLGRRDAALFALLRQTGGRRFEVAALELQNYQPSSGRLEFRAAKRQHERIDHVSGGGRALLDAWIEVRGAAPGSLLCPVDRWGRVEIRKLSVEAIWKACRRRATLAGVPAYHPHDFRHTAATNLTECGVDIRTVQEKLGHRQLTTTQRYVHPTAEALRRAGEMLVVPQRR